MSLRSTLALYLGTAAVALLTVVSIESGVRAAEAAKREQVARDVPAMLRSLAGARIEGREIGNQFLVHNVNLFARHPAPDTVETAFVGTSRTKVLRPHWLGQPDAVNGSGNSYNEISYGLLLQIEAVRLRFPRLKRVYVESSLLLRRPNRLILEPDHRKYLPLLESVMPLRDQLPGADKFRAAIADARRGSQPQKDMALHVAAHRSELRFSQLVAGPESMPVTQDVLFRQLDPDGQRRIRPPTTIPRSQQRPEITIDNVKVQRLRDIPSWAPWDGLFDLVALYGRAHGLEVVLFQPPVRSDLYRFQKEFGLDAHVADLQRVARQYGIPFIDMNRPELGFTTDWSLFSDEDHLDTCAGVVLFQTALSLGEQQFRAHGDVLPTISRQAAESRAAGELRQCGE